MTSQRPATKKTAATKTGELPTTGPKSGDVVKRRPRKSDGGHTLVERNVWTNKTGRQMASWTCQCGRFLRLYGDADNVEASHARHAKKATA